MGKFLNRREDCRCRWCPGVERWEHPCFCNL